MFLALSCLSGVVDDFAANNGHCRFDVFDLKIPLTLGCSTPEWRKIYRNTRILNAEPYRYYTLVNDRVEVGIERKQPFKALNKMVGETDELDVVGDAMIEAALHACNSIDDGVQIVIGIGKRAGEVLGEHLDKCDKEEATHLLVETVPHTVIAKKLRDTLSDQ